MQRPVRFADLRYGSLYVRLSLAEWNEATESSQSRKNNQRTQSTPPQRIHLSKNIPKQPLRLIHGTRPGLDKTSQRSSAKQINTLGYPGVKPLGALFGDFFPRGKKLPGVSRGRKAPPRVSRGWKPPALKQVIAE